MRAIKDLYPSRVSSEPSVTPRQDPVVYSDWGPSAPITNDQMEFYRKSGFLTLENLFVADELSLLQEEAANLQSGRGAINNETIIAEPGSGAVRSVFSVHTQSAMFQRLANDARLVRIAQFLLGEDVYIHQSRLNYKPGFHGKDFFWHSDFETWHVEDGMPRMRALSMSVLLTDNYAVNSPTMFVPASHEQYIACVGETPDNHYKNSLKKQEYGVPDEQILSEMAQRRGVAMPTGPAGTVIVFECNTIHGSNSNITPYPRSNAFIVYNAVSNKLFAPFGPAKPRPEFIAARAETPTLRPISGPITKDAA